MVIRGAIFGVFGGIRTIGGSYALVALFLVLYSEGEDFSIESRFACLFRCLEVKVKCFIYALTLGFRWGIEFTPIFVEEKRAGQGECKKALIIKKQ